MGGYKVRRRRLSRAWPRRVLDRRADGGRAAVEPLETRRLLAVQLLPDLHVLPSYLGDYEVVVEGSQTLLRFSTAMANGGQGAFEIRGAEPPVIVGDLELVAQRIYNSDGTFADRPAGTFEYHPGHGHVHYSGFAQNRLRLRGPSGELGEVVATGDKTSFALLDLVHYAPALPGSPASAVYRGTNSRTQGISVGWSDVYGRMLPGQSIDITGVEAGDYWLEVEADPDDAVLELDETNNLSRLAITIRPDQLPFAGLEVVSSAPRAAAAGPVSQLSVTFRKPVNPATFTVDDVTFTAAGQSVAVSGVQPAPGTNNTRFVVTFPSQSQLGTYTLNIGPNITAADGDLLDGNRNETGGEPEDVYVAIFTIALPQVIAGPDAGGYRALAPAAAPAVDLELGQPGVVLSLNDEDDAFAAINLGTSQFRFHGVNYTGNNQLFVSTNGLVTFGAGEDEYLNGDLTSFPNRPAIAALWDDWLTDFDARDAVLYRFDDASGDGVPDRLVIEWSNVRRVDLESAGEVTFQAILELNTGNRAGEVLLAYPDLTLGDVSYDDGHSATVGMRGGGSGASNRLLVGLNGSSPFVHEGASLRLVSPPAEVVGRHVFYNNSAFDGNDPAAGAGDDAAIAPDKQALLPGDTATFAHYTSYTRGINGIMVDVANLPAGAALTAADFRLRLGNDNAPAAWAAAPAPSSVVQRAGAGSGGSTRVTLIWPDGAIKKSWLEVSVLPGARTGLNQPDVFYFGNAVGETGNSTTNAVVNAADEIGARVHARTPLNLASIDDSWDFNRDRLVNAADQIASRANSTNPLSALRLIAPPAASGTGAAALVGALPASPDDAVLRKRRR